MLPLRTAMIIFTPALLFLTVKPLKQRAKSMSFLKKYMMTEFPGAQLTVKRVIFMLQSGTI